MLPDVLVRGCAGTPNNCRRGAHVVEGFSVLESVFLTQLAVGCQDEFPNVVAVRGTVVIAEQGQTACLAAPIPSGALIHDGHRGLWRHYRYWRRFSSPLCR